MFRGWLALDGEEIANTSRLIAHANPAPVNDLVLSAAACASNCRVDFIHYDDSWPGLQAHLGDASYVIANAPWYNVTIPQSAEFLGIWIMHVDGDGPVPVDRAVNAAICPGGIATPHRDNYRTVTIEAVLLGCTNPGVEYGLEWLSCQLGSAKTLTGTTLDYLSAHPEDSAAVPAALRRTMNRVVLTREPRVTQRYNAGGPNRQGRMLTIDWELSVLDPFTYGPETAGTITWTSSVTESITWAHPPSCADPSSCDTIPILASVECIPNVIDVAPAPPPVCAGCMPVCSVQTRVFTLPNATGVFCEDQVYSFTITAGAGNDVSANFWLRPCGAATLCDRSNFLSLAGLPAGATIVSDSVRGQAYGLISGEQVRQVGIVYTPSGAPWTSAVVDASTCWELVAQHEPGLSFTVQYSVRGRSA
jgi:hypothetical protein